LAWAQASTRPNGVCAASLTRRSFDPTPPTSPIQVQPQTQLVTIEIVAGLGRRLRILAFSPPEVYARVSPFFCSTSVSRTLHLLRRLDALDAREVDPREPLAYGFCTKLSLKSEIPG
jgi:hypothetical protein